MNDRFVPMETIKLHANIQSKTVISNVMKVMDEICHWEKKGQT